MAALTVPLSFGFLAGTVLVTHQCFGFCWALLAQHQGFISPPLCLLQQVGQGWARSWERTRLGQLAKIDPNWPYSRLTKKNGGQAGQRSASGRWQLPLQALFPLPSFPPLTLPLSQPFAVPIPSRVSPREGGSSWAVLKLLARVSPGKLQNMGNFILFLQYTLSLQKKVFTQTDVS